MTQKTAITDRDVTAAKPGSELQDTKQGALRLRVSPKGKKVWLAYFHNPQTKKPTRSVIAPADGPGSLTVKEARLAAAALVSETAKAPAVKPGAVPTFDTVLVHAKPWVETWFGRYCDDWRHKRLNQITEDMVRERERHILKVAGERQRFRDANGGNPERGNPGVHAVSHTAKALRAAYKLAGKRYAGENMGMHMKVTKGDARKRVFEGTEVGRFFNALESPSLSPWVKDFFTLLSWTIARWGNVASMRFSEVDLDAATWTIPGAKFKTGKTHKLPLADEAVAILRRRMEERLDGCPWVFPGAKDPKKHLTDITYPWKKICKLAGLRGLTPHDVRRDGISKIAAKYPISVAQHIAGHSDPRTTSLYYIVVNDAIKREALGALRR